LVFVEEQQALARAVLVYLDLTCCATAADQARQTFRTP